MTAHVPGSFALAGHGDREQARRMTSPGIQRWWVRHGTSGVLAVLAALARVQGRGAGVALRLIASLGTVIARCREVRESQSPAELGRIWQRAFGATKQVPIVAVDATTAYAEIHTRCPLRGTGDLGGCHRMMGYDRAFMREANARFVVLRSQAEPGVSVYRVAIRHHRQRGVDDLVPAHLRVRERAG
jgi:hypothetical protein